MALGLDRHWWDENDQTWSLINRPRFRPGPYVRGAPLGKGGWSIVRKVKRSDGKLFAGKSLRCVEDIGKSIEKMKKEMQTLRSLNHSHILRFVEYHEDLVDPQSTLLVTELCLEGCLQTVISNASHGMPRNQVLRAMMQMAGALDYLHGQELFHADVKPANILVRGMEPLDVVLADCADVKHFNESATAVHGTELYYSPYILSNGHHAGASDDVWALGVCLLGMMAQWPLIVGDGVSSYPLICLDHARDLLKWNEGHDLVAILGRMLCKCEKGRAGAAEIRALCKKAWRQDDGRGAKTIEPGMNVLNVRSPEGVEVIEYW